MKGSTLRHIAKQVNKIIKGKSMDLPICECIMINEGSITATDLQTSYINFVGDTLYYNDASDREFLINWLLLKKAFKGIKATDDVRFACVTLDGKTTCKLMVNGKSVFTHNHTLFIGDFPKIPEINDHVDRFVLGENDVRHVLDAATICSTDELRPAATGVYFDGPNKVVTTDGYRMMWRTTDGKWKNPFIVPRNVTRLLDPAHSYNVHHDNVNVEFVSNGNSERIISRIIDEKFPNYVNVIPAIDSLPTNLLFNRDDLLATMPAALNAADKATKRIILTVNDTEDRMTISSEDLIHETSFSTDVSVVFYTDDVEVIKEEKSHKFTGSDGITYYLDEHDVMQDPDNENKLIVKPCRRIAFNGVYLEQLVKLIDKPMIHVKLQRENRAVIIDNQYLLMPMAID
jgi:DNA polymerase III sliding clamp (beta) subunit (PCNA family)